LRRSRPSVEESAVGSPMPGSLQQREREVVRLVEALDEQQNR
jgi:hypothetical protein